MSIESIKSRRNQYEKILEGWNIQELIGTGSEEETCVFRIAGNQGIEEVGALKVVNIIEVDDNLDKWHKEAKEDYERERDDRYKNALNEIATMNKLKDCPHIMRYLGWKPYDWKNDFQFGRDLLIRMDYRQTIWELAEKQPLDESTIIQIGIDVCKALVVCQSANIIHRDIKPTNIFVDTLNHYLLGDFGIARIVDNSYGASTHTGTKAYAAPEQFDRCYDSRVDIYSLGLTLYILSNKNNLPFKTHETSSTYAIERRRNGVALPPPCETSPELCKVILKACEYDPENRYQSAQQFLDELEELKWQRTGFYKRREDFLGQLRNTPSDGVGIHADSQDVEQNADKDFIIENGVLLKYCGQKKNIVLPEGIVEIAEAAFCKCRNLVSITLANSIIHIGDFAFSACYGLTSVTIPDGVTSIGDWAFAYCDSLTSVTIPNSVTSIGDGVFEGCHALKDVYYGGSEGQWRQIAISEYENESLTSATIHYNSTGIAQAQESSDEDPFAEIFRIFMRSATIPTPQKQVGPISPLFQSLAQMRESSDETPYKSIAKDFIIENGVLVKYCGVSSNIVLPAGIIEVGEKAFKNCAMLVSIVMAEGIQKINRDAFCGCANLTSILLPKSITLIDENAIENQYSHIFTIYVTENSYAQRYAEENKLPYATLSESGVLQKYYPGRGYHSHQKKIIIPDTVLRIGDFAFAKNDEVETVTLPRGMDSIGCQAFFRCSYLTRVSIPPSVKNIKYMAFSDCHALTIHAPINSYAQQYAENHRIPFSEIPQL